MTLSLDPERYARAREVFHEAFGLEDAQRLRLLDEACIEDAELRLAVEQLLRAASEADPLPSGKDL